MKQTEERKQNFVLNIPGLEIPSVANSPTNSQVIFQPCPFLRYSSYEIRSYGYNEWLSIRDVISSFTYLTLSFQIVEVVE